MAKRFTDTEKWKRQWFRELTPTLKSFYFFILDNCDSAGVWMVDLTRASFEIGMDLPSPNDIIEKLDGRVIPVSELVWWVRDFIEFQYGCVVGALNPKSKVHVGVLRNLSKYGINKSLSKGYQRVSKGLVNPPGQSVGVGVSVSVIPNQSKDISDIENSQDKIELDKIEIEEKKIRDFYLSEFNHVGSGYELKRLTSWLDDGFEADVVIHAMQEGLIRNKRNVSYVLAILKNLEAEGVKTVKGLEIKKAARQQDKAAGGTNKEGQWERGGQEAERIRGERLNAEAEMQQESPEQRRENLKKIRAALGHIVAEK